MKPGLTSAMQLTINSTSPSYMIEYFSQRSMWIYSREHLSLYVTYVSSAEIIDGLGMNAGWNFVAVNYDMVGKTLNEFKGSCDLARVYSYNNPSNSWEKVTDRKIVLADLGKGLILHEKETCRLVMADDALKSTGDVAPPMPN